MQVNVKLITDMTTEPITLAEAKRHLRIDESYTDEDDDILDWIKSARLKAEKHTGRSLGTKTLELISDKFPAVDYIEIPKGPVQSVTSIIYTDKEEAEHTFGSDNYVTNLDIVTPIIKLKHGKSWPSDTLYPTGAIRIRYVAGYTVIPSDIKSAIKLEVGDFYINRENVTEKQQYEILNSSKKLLNSYRLEFL